MEPARFHERCIRILAATTAVVLALSVGACGGNGEDDTDPAAAETESTTADTAGTTTEPAKVIPRAELKSCLADAGLKPQDTADVVVSTSGPVLRGIGVEFPSGSRVVLFADESASSAEAVAQVQQNAAPDAEVVQSGNVAITYLTPPTEAEQAQIDDCLAD